MRKFSFVTTPSRDRHRDFKVNCAPEQHQLERGSIFHPELFGRLRLLEGGDDIRRELAALSAEIRMAIYERARADMMLDLRSKKPTH
jgi:hypothetical protein